MICFKLLFFKLFSFGLFLSTVSQKSGVKFLGCFLEDNLLSLGEESSVLTQTSPYSCSEFCSVKQYLFFILKHDTCYCSKNYISRLMRQFDYECSIKCTGDESASCGGTPNLVSSYITDSSKVSNFIEHGGYPIPIYLGCYSEMTETPNDLENRLLNSELLRYDNSNTPQKCSDTCFKMGYLYFGLEYGLECFCGNYLPSISLKVQNTNCNAKCSGDSKQICGGGWLMGIYSTGISDHVPKKYVGCYEDDDKKNKEKHLSYHMGKNNSPKRCMNLCNTQRLKFAALKGDDCECTNSEPKFNLKRSFDDCNNFCQGNPTEYCGGNSTSNIYKTFYSDDPGNVAINYIGCFKNLKRHPILNGWRITYSGLTPKHCVYGCNIRRFPYAALVSPTECICSFTKPSNKAKTENNMCTSPCSGSSQQSCGGDNTINVYNTGLEWNTDAVGNYYLGCFLESENNRIFNSYYRSFAVNTPEFCSNICYKFGYAYSGVTYKSECFCGNQPPNEIKFSKVSDENCDTKCSGDANQFCGGGWRMGVFSTGLNGVTNISTTSKTAAVSQSLPELTTQTITKIALSCVIPNTEGSIYTSAGQSAALSPGTKVLQYTTIEESCKAEYHKVISGRHSMICMETGKWLSTFSDKLCLRKCPPMTSDSLDMKCIYNGDYADCSNPSIPGTKLTPKCKVTYKMDNPSGYTPTVLRCLNNGTWNDRINLRCVPECGRLFPPNNPLIYHGTPVKHGSVPWNVAIYRKNDTNKTNEFICGGTIISPNLVVSAAHCFSAVELVPNVLMSNGVYKIGVGKYTRDISTMDNQFTKIIDVNSVHMHDEYSGADGFYNNDIAVIVLSDNVEYSSMVAPVCVDWTKQYTALNGSIGKVAGWGKTENSDSSTVLLEANLPYLSRKTCLKHFSNAFKSFLTLDKYCAGFIESSGSAVHKGDSGAGFTLVHNDLHYLTGTVSLNDPNASHLIAAFTEVRYHIEWIRKILTDMKLET